MPESDATRRQLLATGGASLVAALAGCSSFSTTDSDRESSSSGPLPNSTRRGEIDRDRSSTDSSTGSDGNNGDGGSDDVRIVELYDLNRATIDQIEEFDYREIYKDENDVTSGPNIDPLTTVAHGIEFKAANLVYSNNGYAQQGREYAGQYTHHSANGDELSLRITEPADWFDNDPVSGADIFESLSGAITNVETFLQYSFVRINFHQIGSGKHGTLYIDRDWMIPFFQLPPDEDTEAFEEIGRKTNNTVQWWSA
jgi:hypothetical protein